MVRGGGVYGGRRHGEGLMEREREWGEMVGCGGLGECVLGLFDWKWPIR